nr:hypothetical protein [Tanacetum cinerariifolium]
EHIHEDPTESSIDFDVEAKGWRTTHNHWKQRDNKQEKNEIMKSDHKNETDIKHLVDSAKTSSRMCYQPNENESGINTQTESSTSRKRVQRNHNNRIEIKDLDDSPIASSRVRDIPDAEELGIDRQPESSTSRNREPNVQIPGNNEDLSVRALQMEEDEIFAQQLQHQLYNEELERVDMLAIAAAAEGDMVRNDLLQVDREFNENDYEMLLALDEDNYKHQEISRGRWAAITTMLLIEMKLSVGDL